MKWSTPLLDGVDRDAERRLVQLDAVASSVLNTMSFALQLGSKRQSAHAT